MCVLAEEGGTQDSRVWSIYRDKLRPQIRAEGSQRQELVEDTEYLRKNYSLCFWKRVRDCKAVRQGALQQPEPQVGQGLQWPIKGGGGVGVGGGGRKMLHFGTSRCAGRALAAGLHPANSHRAWSHHQHGTVQT